MLDAHGARAHVLRSLRLSLGRKKWGGWDLEQNLRRMWQRASHGDKRASGGNIHGSGELKKIFAFFIFAANENWDGQG